MAVSLRPAFTPAGISDVVLDDRFWSPKLKVWREVTLPDAFAKFEKDGTLANFARVRDGLAGEHGGPPWYDGMVYEMICAASDFLASRHDAKLEAFLDKVIDLIRSAADRDTDGYVNTYSQLVEPEHRWGLNGGKPIWLHETYNMGCLAEAAAHHYRATGKTNLLEVAARIAAHMASIMGPPPKLPVITEHPLPEEAFVKLYRVLRDDPALLAHVEREPILRLAEYWVTGRGSEDGRASLGAYAQDHRPVIEQNTIEGHAVRAALLCAGIVEVAVETGREDLLNAARRLWRNMVERRMHITGGIGSFAGEEDFAPDYVLPSRAYLETCAAVAAAFFHANLGMATGDSRCFDELERALYNGALAGVSSSGDRYFYENPLEAESDRMRWEWHSCACCPPMFLKLMAALPGMVYASADDSVVVNLFVSGSGRIETSSGPITVHQETAYPWDGLMTLRADRPCSMRVRVPGWLSEAPNVSVDCVGQEPVLVDGYLNVVLPSAGSVCAIEFPMPPMRMRAHSAVEELRGRIALQRGPLVYCVEGVDNDGNAGGLTLPDSSELSVTMEPDLLGGVAVIRAPALRAHEPNAGPGLYARAGTLPPSAPVTLTSVPYYANANREPCDMRVWIPEHRA